MKRITVFLFLFLASTFGWTQKVGLVFSGGGAKGLAHIGVLKALEENNIPIDYIIGTSMGGIVGGMYAAGYSPAEIEQIALSKNFQDWVGGKFDSDYRYFFQKKPENPSFVSATLQIDNGFQPRLRSNLVNDVSLNFALIELFSQASAIAKDDFDHLFIPFRCIVADVLSQKTIAVKQGSLAEALRGTMTVPLIYRPVKVNNHYVFDGGLYDNFPADIMVKEFKPDIIIGSNVSIKTFNDYPTENDEKLMGRFLIYMFLSKTDSTALGKNGIYIQPNLANFSSSNFSPVKEMIKAGYDATIADMPRIKANIEERNSPGELTEKREAFLSQRKPLVFQDLLVTDINDQRRRYVEQVFRKNKKPLTLSDIRESYYQLVANDNFETIYPRIVYLPATDEYNFEIQVKSNKSFRADFGGCASSRPVGAAYLGLQYNYLNRNSFTLSANFYSGRFYESAQLTMRTDFPARLPFYLETEFNYNFWNFFSTNQIFVEKVKPIYIAQSDRKVVIKAGIPIKNNNKLEIQAGYINTGDQYSPTNDYENGDTLDITHLNAFKTALSLDRNSLNRKQYASKGIMYAIGIEYITGNESYTPGNITEKLTTVNGTNGFETPHYWFKAKIIQENYFLITKKYSLGYYLEGVLSNQPLFYTYKSSLLNASSFNPLQDSKTLYLQNFRSNNFGAFGLKNVITFTKNLDMRLEAFIFQPFEVIKMSGLEDQPYKGGAESPRFVGTGGLVYHSFAGPISLSFNYYDDPQKRYGIMFHAGFLLFNKKATE
ncbi:MAG: patatin-like phospholipase family protein [Sphingobacteriaceae bacterium]